MTSTIVLISASLCLLLVGVSCQGNREDELKFRGEEATTDQTLINDKPQPNPNQSNNNNNNNNNQLQPSSTSPATIDLDDDDDDQHRQQQQDLNPFRGGFGGGFGSGFGSNSFGGSFGNNQGLPGGLLSSLFGGNLFEGLRRHQQSFEQRFQDLERQAGEGQDVSYFNRNGVAYVRTCTTKKVE